MVNNLTWHMVFMIDILEPEQSDDTLSALPSNIYSINTVTFSTLKSHCDK